MASVANFAPAFRTLFVWSMQALTLPPFLLFLLAALANLIAALICQKPLRSGMWKRWCYLSLAQLAFFPAIVCVGALFPAEHVRANSANPVGEWACDILGVLSLALGAYWIYRSKGFRWFAASVVFLVEIILMGALFIAGMAVSGDWL